MRNHRCCMCPNIGFPDGRVCPGVPGSLHPEESPCDFVVIWRDRDGTRYFVRSCTGIGLGYKGHHLVPNAYILPIEELERRERFDEAQEDLNRLAMEKGWLVFA